MEQEALNFGEAPDAVMGGIVEVRRACSRAHTATRSERFWSIVQIADEVLRI